MWTTAGAGGVPGPQGACRGEGACEQMCRLLFGFRAQRGGGGECRRWPPLRNGGPGPWSGAVARPAGGRSPWGSACLCCGLTCCLPPPAPSRVGPAPVGPSFLELPAQGGRCSELAPLSWLRGPSQSPRFPEGDCSSPSRPPGKAACPRSTARPFRNVPGCQSEPPSGSQADKPWSPWDQGFLPFTSGERVLTAWV